jgi:hypothetical protein
MKFTRLGSFTLGVVIAAVSVGAVTFANASSNATIKACANKTTGAMRYIAKGSCKKTETSLSWNQMGPQGLAATSVTGTKGDTGAAGAKGDTGAAGAKGDTGAAAAIPTTTVPSQKVGDIGPGGGPIFYVDMADLYSFTYLEVAPSNATENAKNCYIPGLDFTKTFTTSGPLTSDTFGQGQNNTLTLLAMCKNTTSPYAPPFGTLIDSFNQGWYIPNIAEMKVLLNAETLGLINLSRPLRDPITPYVDLMTSSLYPDNSGISGGAKFWGWSAIVETYNVSATYNRLEGNALRLIRAR